MSSSCNYAILMLFWSGLWMLSPGAAQGSDEGALFKEGVERFNAGDYEAAAKSFRAAYSLKPSWKLLYNIGQSEAAAKHYDLALEAFETYLAKGGDEIQEERSETVLAEVERLRKMVGSVEVSAPLGAVIYVDDIERGTAPLVGKLTVTAGIVHRIHAVLGEERVGERAFRIRGGDTLGIDLGEEASAPVVEDKGASAMPGGPGETDDKGDASRSKKGLSPLGITGAVVAGLGGGGLIAAIATGVITRNLDKDLHDACPGGVCSSRELDKRDKMDKMRRATNILLISGGSVAAIGIALVVADLVRKKENTSHRTAMTPFLSPDCFGLGIQGRF